MEWSELEFKAGPEGVAVAEALGLDATKIAAEPIQYLEGTDTVHLRYYGVLTVGIDRWRKVQKIVGMPIPEMPDTAFEVPK